MMTFRLSAMSVALVKKPQFQEHHSFQNVGSSFTSSTDMTDNPKVIILLQRREYFKI